jgi:hypothetical protein
MIVPRSWPRTVAVLSSVLVVTLVMAEASLRLLWREDMTQYLYLPDEKIGWVHRPGVSGHWYSEGYSAVRINTAGLRGPEVSAEKPEGTVRIAVLGDSFTEALQVSERDSFPKILERGLSGCGRRPLAKVEVLNFGVSSYGTFQEYLMLHERVWRFNPDIVIVAFYAGNDVEDNSLELHSNFPDRPFLVSSGGEWTIDRTFLRPEYRPQPSTLRSMMLGLRARSRTLQALSVVQKGLAIAVAARAARDTDSAGRPKSPAACPVVFTDRPEVFAEPTNSTWERAWAVTERALLLIRDEVNAHHARLVVVTLSAAHQVLPDPGLRRSCAARIGATDLFYPDRRIDRFAAVNGIETVILAPTLAAYAEQTGKYLHGFDGQDLGDGHWNRNAHQLAGELLARRVCGT